VKRIGEKLYTLRKQHGLTTRQLAEHLETSHAQISRIENGLRQPTGDMILKMSAFFRVSLDQLMKDELEVDRE